MLSSLAISSIHLSHVPKTESGTGKVQLMIQTYLLLARERAWLQQQREGHWHIGSYRRQSQYGVGGTGVPRYLSPASTLWREDADRITTYGGDI